MSKYYRFIVGTKGVYEAVESDCPRDDPRRKNKPDGSWLVKIGTKYPSSVSFWTKEGLKKYLESGLMKWHTSVVKGDVELIIIEKPDKILYEDKYQIIVDPKVFKIKEKLKLSDFLKKKNSYV